MTKNSPRLFVSYSWSSPEHEKWVLNLATELRSAGVDVVLDKWDLKEGHDAIAFMEKMVLDPSVKKVIMICDKEYAEKADKRSGGVGTEAQIISPNIYKKVDQDKFVAVIAERDEHGEPCVPVYYQGRIYVDLSEDSLYASNFEQLLRWVYDKPLHVKPKLGTPPAFLSGKNTVSLGTEARFGRALDAIRNNRPHAAGALAEYFGAVIENMDVFRIEKVPNKEFDDQIIENIENFIPYRDELIEIFILVAQHSDTQETRRHIHRFFEQLIPFLSRPKDVNQWQEWDWDNLKFIIQELFLYLVAILAKYERFSFLGYMLKQQYYVEYTVHGEHGKMVPFSNLRNHLRSFDYRNNRLKSHRLSLHADLLKKRCNGTSVTFSQLMQGDLILFVRDSLDALRNKKGQDWWPETLLYADQHYGPFEIFARAQSKTYFDSIKVVFDIGSVDDLKKLIEALSQGRLRTPSWQFTQPEIYLLINFENLGTQP